MLNIERLHTVIDTCVPFADHRGVERGAGLTTAYLQLMLGEAQLADSTCHYVYVTCTADHAIVVLNKFVRMLHCEPALSIYQQTRDLVRLTTGPTFFFVGLTQFTQTFSFLGTRVDKVFVDLSNGVPPLTEDFYNKIAIIESRGAEIL